MAHVCRHFDAAPEDVWSVIVDPWTYPEWLLGASVMREVDENWPSPGSKFHHAVGVKPFVLPDHSQVLDIEPGRRLVLHVKARPLVTARVTFEIIGASEGCVLTCEEEPTLRTIGNIGRPLMDPMIHFRNHRSLRQMEQLVMERKQRRLREAASRPT